MPSYLLLNTRALIFIFWSPRIRYVSCHWLVGGDGDSRRQQYPEFLLVNIGILTASFYKHCHWQLSSDIRSMWAGCSRGSEEPLGCVFVINGMDFLVVVSLCHSGHFAVISSCLFVLSYYKNRTNLCVNLRDIFFGSKSTMLYATIV
jgi:hypothetical protein